MERSSESGDIFTAESNRLLVSVTALLRQINQPGDEKTPTTHLGELLSDSIPVLVPERHRIHEVGRSVKRHLNNKTNKRIFTGRLLVVGCWLNKVT